MPCHFAESFENMINSGGTQKECDSHLSSEYGRIAWEIIQALIAEADPDSDGWNLDTHSNAQIA